jgi:hypothetical protein
LISGGRIIRRWSRRVSLVIAIDYWLVRLWLLQLLIAIGPIVARVIAVVNIGVAVAP